MFGRYREASSSPQPHVQRNTDIVLNSVFTTYTDLQRDLKVEANQLEVMLTNHEAPELIMDRFDNWQLLYEQYLNTSAQLRELIPSDRVAEHIDEASHFSDLARAFMKKVTDHLSATRPSSSPIFSSHQPWNPEAAPFTPSPHQPASQPTATFGHSPTQSTSFVTWNKSSTGSPFRSPLQPSASPYQFRQPRAPRPAGYGWEPLATPAAPVAPRLHPSASPYVPQDPTEQLLHRLANIMSAKSDSLPKAEPSVFSGKLMEFPSWWSGFEAMVEQRVPEDRDKLFLLGKYTSEGAHEAVKPYLSLYDHPEAYVRAREALLTRFGDKVLIADAFKAKLNSWPRIKKGDGPGLQKYADFLWACQAAIGSISYLGSLETREENVKLALKLPQNLSERWERQTVKRMYREEWSAFGSTTTLTGEYPSFSEFCSFVSAEARIATGPCSAAFSAHSTSETKSPGADSERHSQRDRHRGSHHERDRRRDATYRPTISLNTQAARPKPEASASNNRKPRETPPCTYCTKPHLLQKCVEFLKLPAAERKLFAERNECCFGCLRKGHGYRVCRSRNPDLLRDDPQSQQTPHKAVTNTITERPKDIEQSMTGKFAAAVIPVTLQHAQDPSLTVSTYALLDTQSTSCFFQSDIIEQLDLPHTKVKLELETLGNVSVIESQLVEGLIIKGQSTDSLVPLPPSYSRDHIPCDTSSIPRKEDIQRYEHLREAAEVMESLPDNITIGLLVGFNVPEAFISHRTLFQGYDKPFAMRSELGWVIMGRLGNADSPRSRQMSFRTRVKELTSDDLRAAFDCDFKQPPPGRKMSQQDLRFLKLMKEGLEITPDGHIQLPLPLKVDNPVLPESRKPALRRFMYQQRGFQKNPVHFERYRKFVRGMIDDLHAERVPESELANPWKNYLSHHGVYHPFKPNKLRVVHNPSMEVDGITLNSLLITGPDLMNNLAGVLINFRREKHALVADIEKMFFQVLMTPKFRDLFRFFWYEDDKLDGKIIEYRMRVHLFGAVSSPACANYALKQTAELFGHEFSEDAARFLRDRFYMDDGLDSKAEACEAVRLAREAKDLCSRGGFNLCKFTSNSLEVLEALPEEWLAPGAKDMNTVDLDADPDRLLGVGWHRKKDALVYKIILKVVKLTRRNMLSLLSAVYDPLGLISAVLLPGRLLLQKLCQDKLQWDELVSEDYQGQWRAWYDQLEDLGGLFIPRCYRRTVSLPLEVVELHLFADASCQAYGCAGYLVLGDRNARDSSLIFGKSRVGPSKIPTIPRMELQAAVLAAETAEYLLAHLDYENIVVFFWTDSMIVLGYICNETRKFHLYVTNRVQAILRVSTKEQWGHVQTHLNPADIASRGISAAEIIDSSLWWKGPDFLTTGNLPTRDTTSYPENIPVDDPEVKRETPAHRKSAVLSTAVRRREEADRNQIEQFNIPLTQDELLATVGEPLDETPRFNSPADIARTSTTCLITPLVEATVVEEVESSPLSERILESLKRLSSWYRVRATVGVIFKYLCLLHVRSRGKMLDSKEDLRASLAARVAARRADNAIPYKSPLTVGDNQRAERWIIREVQRQAFPKEVKILSANPEYPTTHKAARERKVLLKPSSNMYRLDPFIDPEGVLRIGGRLRRSDINVAECHPIVLPRRHFITTLLIRYCHELAAHGGRGLTLAYMRSAGYWVCQGKGTISSIIKDCVICTRIRGQPCTQMTADLPDTRVTPTAPFTHVAADFFGPFMVKAPTGRATLKRWACAFTCLSMRGLHVEIASEMSTSSFLMAFRRFNGRRGPVRSISCDRGTNFIGGKSAMQEGIRQMNLEEIKSELVAENCDIVQFAFNPAHASEMNGTIERMIRTIRAALHGVLRHHGPRLTEEELSTFIIEAENVVNSRPITAVPDPDSDGLTPLTPMRLLTMKSSAVLPLPGIFTKADVYCRSRWRAVQFLADQFWFQWRREFLPTLQERRKNHTPKPNLRTGDIVIMVDPQEVRNKWPMGVVVSASPSDDGLVRRVTIRTTKGEYERPVTKVILLMRRDDL